MLITRFFAAVALCLATSAAFTQTIPARSVGPAAASSAADETNVPKLEHFDANLVDKTLDPCNDFYKYSCNKWLTANPIPADQVYWSTGSGLQLWNEGVLRDTLEAASKNDPNRSAVQQKIGDYWAACMDESGIEAAGLKPLQSELARVATLKTKKDITLEIAHLQHVYPGAWQPGDNESS
jgi:putative endopeptidase